MRQLIHHATTSLDGFAWDVDGSIPPGTTRTAWWRRVDTLIVGRKTYEQLIGAGEWPYPGRACYVLSRRWAGACDAQARFVGGDVVAFLRRLKRRPGRDLWLVGGGEVVRLCLEAGLVDELYLNLVPSLPGSGRPWLPPGDALKSLRLTGSRTLAGGIGQLRYGRRRAQPTGSTVTATRRMGE